MTGALSLSFPLSYHFLRLDLSRTGPSLERVPPVSLPKTRSFMGTPIVGSC